MKVHVHLVILGVFIYMHVEFFPLIFTLVISKGLVDANTALLFRFL